MKNRKTIPTELKDRLLVECGYKCTVPNCEVSQSLEFHHIDSNPSNNKKENIIVLCAVHHHQADLRKISKRSLYLMKKILLDIDGTLESSRHSDVIEITLDDFGEYLRIIREMPKASLRILSREFIRYLLSLDTGYRCRRGLDYQEFLVQNKLVVEEEAKGPSLFKISEKGKILCKFLYTSQYNLPNVYFDQDLDSEMIKRIFIQKERSKFVCFGRFVGKIKKRNP